MNLTENLQYLHDQLSKVEGTNKHILLIHSLRAFIKNGFISHGYYHDAAQYAAACTDEVRINKAKKPLAEVCAKLDLYMAVEEYLHATVISVNAAGTKQANKVVAFQEKRIVRAKKVLDLL